jgi:hypothetical protein
MFVIFRQPSEIPTTEVVNFPEYTTVQELTGPWALEFDPKWGGPPAAQFNQLVSWTERPEAGIKFYSGTAIYRMRFDLAVHPDQAGRRVNLDLGGVRELAEVRLNGKAVGLVWTAPWRVDIGDAVLPNGNELEIRVTNLWPNRLIGDAALPVQQRLTTTNITADKFPALLDSGLLGPVRVLSVAK